MSQFQTSVGLPQEMEQPLKDFIAVLDGNVNALIAVLNEALQADQNYYLMRTQGKPKFRFLLDSMCYGRLQPLKPRADAVMESARKTLGLNSASAAPPAAIDQKSLADAVYRRVAALIPKVGQPKAPEATAPDRKQKDSEIAAIDKLGLRDIFRMDFSDETTERDTRIWYVNRKPGQPKGIADVTTSPFDFEYIIVRSPTFNSKFLAYYLSATDDTRRVCEWLATHMDSVLNDGVQMSYTTKVPGDSAERSTGAQVFTGYVYLYHESHLADDAVVSLTKLFADNRQSVIFRSIDYLYTKKLEMKLARMQH